jgi:superfamily I DNA/RNA helicase
MFESADGLERLNDDQRRAAVHDGGPLLILAGAGTGKTGTLVARATWLRSRGIPASRIMLLTFTRRAADDIMARVAPANAAASERICGGTFHAIAHRIIREHAESFALPPEFSVLDPADVTDLMDRLRAEHDLVGTARRAPRAAVCADIYTRCVNTRTTVAEVVQAGFPWCTDFTPALSGLFRGYVAHKRQHGLVDFDDLLLLWRAALADEAAGPALRGLFGAVLVDEYQDVNAVQADIVRLLRPDGRADRHLPGPDRAPAGPQLPVPAGRARAGQRGPAAVGRARAGPDRGPAGRLTAAAGPLPRRGHPGPGDLRAGAQRPRERHRPEGPGRAGPHGAPHGRAGDRAGCPRYPVP